MDFFTRQIFHSEVKRQCTFALMAYEDLKLALTAVHRPRPEPPAPRHADISQVRATTENFHQWQAAMKQYQQMSDAAHERVWYAVQAFLVAAGNISKLLWPSYRNGEALIPERGDELRASLVVEEDSPLASRTLRNHFEHFDMRLEEWAVSSTSRMFIDSNIGRGFSVRVSGSEPTDYLRNFDLHDFAVTFRGERFHLRPIAEAIEQLWHKAAMQLQQRASA